MDGVSKQTKASSKAAEEAFYGFSDFFKDVDRELAERRARRAGALLAASPMQACDPAAPCVHLRLAQGQAHLAGVLDTAWTLGRLSSAAVRPG